MKTNTIIYPTDFSPCAENAMKFALHFAKATKSQLKIIHEIDLTGMQSSSMLGAESMRILSMMEDEAQAKLSSLMALAQEEGVQTETEILVGDKLDYFLKNYENDGQTWIVMGTNGENSLENRLFGSKTHQVIREVDFPVFVVPIEAKFDGIAEILFATDYSVQDIQQLKLLTEIGSYFHSNIRVVHVSEGTFSDETEAIFLQDFEERIRKEISYQQMDFQLLYAHDIEDRLHAMIKEDHIELLVLITQKRNFFERFFGKSLTKKMVYHTHIPMLVFSKK